MDRTAVRYQRSLLKEIVESGVDQGLLTRKEADDLQQSIETAETRAAIEECWTSLEDDHALIRNDAWSRP